MSSHKNKGTSPKHWPAQNLVKMPPHVLAQISEKKLAAVVGLWQRRWGWPIKRCQEMLRLVRAAKRQRKKRPPVVGSQHLHRASLPKSTQPEVVAVVRALLMPLG